MSKSYRDKYFKFNWNMHNNWHTEEIEAFYTFVCKHNKPCIRSLSDQKMFCIAKSHKYRISKVEKGTVFVIAPKSLRMKKWR